MKYLNQFGIIAGICMVGEFLHTLLPFPVPASVYGLILLFILLMTKIIKIEQVEDISRFFLGIMPILFISPSVSLIESVNIVKGNIIALFSMIAISTVGVTVVTGIAAQKMINRKRQKTMKE